jgi:branched-chain amino acid transport system ATP-binding protein
MASLECCGVAAMAGKPVKGLPLGVRRRVDLARALVRTPTLLLLDEPAPGLSNDERALVRELVQIARKDGRAAVIWIEHDLDLVVTAATRVAVLHHGRVVTEGAPQEGGERKRLIEAYLSGNIEQPERSSGGTRG